METESPVRSPCGQVTGDGRRNERRGPASVGHPPRMLHDAFAVTIPSAGKQGAPVDRETGWAMARGRAQRGKGSARGDVGNLIVRTVTEMPLSVAVFYHPAPYMVGNVDFVVPEACTELQNVLRFTIRQPPGPDATT